MKALVRDVYGSPKMLAIEDVPTPIPGPGEVQVRVHAASLNMLDSRVLRAKPWLIRSSMGFLRPRFRGLGADFAGVVTAVGPDVTRWSKGDEVFGDNAGNNFGSFAEYLCARADEIAIRPTNVSPVAAAASPVAAVTSLQCLRDHGQLKSGQHVLINGASGGVGTFAIQVAKLLGARVTGVCSSAKVQRAQELGADNVIDYTQADFTDDRFDVILDLVGNASTWALRRLLRDSGVALMASASLSRMAEALAFGWLRPRGTRIKICFAKADGSDLAAVAQWLGSGELKPFIEHTYSLSEYLPAFDYLEQGHAAGKLVLQVSA